MLKRDTDHGTEMFCTNCQTWRAIALFAKSKRDGYQNRCRECKRVDRKVAYHKDPEKFRAQARAVPAERKRARVKAYREKNPNQHIRQYLLEKARTGLACNHVVNACRAGTMTTRPCEVCGSENVQGHHDDYREPFTVRWLCRKHHTDWHNCNRPVYLPGWEAEFARLLVEWGLSVEIDALPAGTLLGDSM